MSREALVLLVCCCDFRDGAERLIPSKSLRNAVIRAFPGLLCILRMCAPRRAAAVVRPRGREKSADRRRRILISRLLIIRASVPRRKSPFPAYFKGFPAVSPLIPPYPAFLKYPVSPHRDNKLFDQTLLRSSMDAYFDMGGCEYLESRIDATEYGELLPTVDDAVCGLISILDALNTGDNDRFHLETLHHSKQEILRILERGGKIDRTVEYAVDDEDEEYEQYHGFSMRM